MMARGAIRPLAVFVLCVEASSAVTAVHARLRFPPTQRVSAGAELRFDSWVALVLRHPVILGDGMFTSWRSGRLVGTWTESAPEADGHQNVVVLNTAANDAYVARIRTSGEPALVASAVIQLSVSRNTLSDVLAQLAKAGLSDRAVRQLEPRVTFDADLKPSLTWRLRVERAARTEWFDFSDGRLAGPLGNHGDRTPRRLVPRLPSADADALATNDLHHPEQYVALVADWISGKATVQEQARAIFKEVHRAYRSGGSSFGIAEFVWSDTLVDGNGSVGMCDELSVVLISHLRAAGIPSRLKLLVLTFDGQDRPSGHAAVEYFDGANWQHADLIAGFNNRGVYRTIKDVTKVEVMTATFPDDSRSTALWLTLPDPNGDGQLNPLGDLLLSSPFPGALEPGYSY